MLIKLIILFLIMLIGFKILQIKNSKRLYLSNTHKLILGVCSGIAEFLNIGNTEIRIILVLLCLVKGIGIPIYIICYLLMKRR